MSQVKCSRRLNDCDIFDSAVRVHSVKGWTDKSDKNIMIST